MNIYQGIAIGLAVIAVVWDLATKRIPNLLTFGAALAAFAVHGFVEGWTGAGTSFAGWVVGAAFFFPFFALRGMGAGDVKLLAAVGAWLGPAAIVWVALFSGSPGACSGWSWPRSPDISKKRSRTSMGFSGIGGLPEFDRRPS